MQLSRKELKYVSDAIGEKACQEIMGIKIKICSTLPFNNLVHAEPEKAPERK